MQRVIMVILALLILADGVYYVHLLESEGFSRIHPLKKGAPYRIYDTEQCPRDEVTSFIATEEEIILYYDDCGLINVYGLDGEFQYGIQVECIKNGRGNIGYLKGLLYIRARSHKIYIFDGTSLIESYSSQDKEEDYRWVNKFVEREKQNIIKGTEYYYQNELNQIISKTRSGIEEVVVALPQKNKGVYTTGMLFLILIAVFAWIWDQRKSKVVK